jgi:hypothetical protein
MKRLRVGILACCRYYLFLLQNLAKFNRKYTKNAQFLDLFSIILPTCFGLVWPSSGQYTIRIPRFTGRQYKQNYACFVMCGHVLWK